MKNIFLKVLKRILIHAFGSKDKIEKRVKLIYDGLIMIVIMIMIY